MEYDPEEERLDWISERYERWAQYPQLHIEHIRSRTIEGGKTVVRNKRGLIVDRNLDDRIPVKEGVRG